MTQRLTFHMIRDGIVTGALSRTLLTCPLCQASTCGILLTSVEGVDISRDPASVLFAQAMRSHVIGLGCGCYAKAHRQLAYIKSKARS